ncbi:MAG TPA: glycosyltransferase family 9 protein [Thermoanaerobaculia bacterium]|nr:glycosyltransferase family 9 protein [Thermoanaerobaculia bacterium]
MAPETLKALARTAVRGLERGAAEALVWSAGRLRPRASWPPAEPRSILVLRNNDIGDLLVVTPLFEALRRRFPTASITAAVGRWNVGVLRGNPHISEVLAVDAPWFNKFVPRQGALRALGFIASSPAGGDLARRRFDVGIDVLGSAWGSLLMLRAGIPYRLGVRGYAGGHSAVQAWVEFDPWQHVGRGALRFAELLGAADLPPCRPQLFLSAAERAAGEEAWDGGEYRIAVGPGAGLTVKSWPAERWEELTGRLAKLPGVRIAVAGGPGERRIGEQLAALSPGVRNLAGHLSLRETFALAAAADLVICNSSMLMHAAAAFGKPTVVLLGESFPSARQHDAQWGYPGTCWSLGKEPGERSTLYTAEEALVRVEELIA